MKFRLDKKFDVEKVENLIVGLKIERAQERSDGHFPCAVNTNGNSRRIISLQLPCEAFAEPLLQYACR